MKPQDLIFIASLCGLLFIKKEKLFLFCGLGALLLAIPLYSQWIFFTAERLVWYGSAYIIVFLAVHWVQLIRNNK